jgi:acyl-CoA synthetase (NDP forming)
MFEIHLEMNTPIPDLEIARRVIARTRANGGRTIDEHQAKSILTAFGISTPHGLHIVDEAASTADIAKLRFPLAVKIISRDIHHKSEGGFVALNLTDHDQVRAEIQRMRAVAAQSGASIDGFLVEEMAPPGVEVVIGSFRDPTFGSVIMFGLGGLYIEVLRDVSFRVCPIDRADAADMIDELKFNVILDGARGGVSVDRETLIDLLLVVGGEDGLLSRFAGEIAELDINPIIMSGKNAVAVDALMLLSEQNKDGDVAEPTGASTTPHFDALFSPRTIAVAGASSTNIAYGNRFIRTLRSCGFAGDIYPIHPRANEIEGLPAYPSLAATPKPIDYAFVAVNAGQVTPLIDTAKGNVRFAQIMSSGFADIPSGVELERELVRVAHGNGVRVIGPNCIGLHSPRGKLSLINDLGPAKLGVAFISQSGGLSLDVLRYGRTRGVDFSAVVSLGNSSDIGPADMLEYFLNDPDTKVIGLYLEQVRDGRRLYELLRDARARKPIIILKGGRTRFGQRAAASHTGALANDQRIWDAVIRQTGSIAVGDLDDLMTMFMGVQNHGPASAKPIQQVILFGNGGGTSVIATDQFADFGIEIGPLTAPLAKELDTLKVPHGASVANPIDVPANLLLRDGGETAGRIIASIFTHAANTALVFHLNLSVMGNYDDNALIERMVENVVAAAKVSKNVGAFHLVLRSDRATRTEELKQRLIRKVDGTGITVLDEISDSARVLNGLRDLTIFRDIRAL